MCGLEIEASHKIFDFNYIKFICLVIFVQSSLPSKAKIVQFAHGQRENILFVYCEWYQKCLCAGFKIIHKDNAYR